MSTEKFQHMEEPKPFTPDSDLSQEVNEMGVFFQAERDRVIAQSGTVDKFKEKTRRKIAQMAKVFGLAMSLVAVGLNLTYATNRYEVSSKIEQDSSVTFDHEDPETTLLLNYLTSKSELPFEMRLAFARANIKHWIIDTPNPLPENFDNLGEKELHKLLIERGFAVSSDNLKEENWLDYLVPKKFDLPFTKDRYAALWKTEKLVGAPKIRIMQNPLLGATNFYNPVTNTIYLDEISNYFDEIPHSKQAEDHPVKTAAQFLRDMAWVLKESAKSGGSMKQAKRDLYDKPGSFEYEAHNIIQPTLSTKPVIHSDSSKIKK